MCYKADVSSVSPSSERMEEQDDDYVTDSENTFAT